MTTAEYLVDVAAASVLSFFVSSEDYGNHETDFVGFVRDSLLTKSDFSLSTGGLAVSAHLWQIDPYLTYLKENRITNRIVALRTSRDLSTTYLLTKKTIPLEMPSSFGVLNPMTTALCAYLGACAVGETGTWNPRAALFSAVNASYFVTGSWPELENVDKPHPYVAYGVHRAAAALTKTPSQAETLVDIISEPNFLDQCSIKVRGSDRSQLKNKLHQCARFLKSASKDGLANRIRDSHNKFAAEAEQYLWEQVGFAPSYGSAEIHSLQYDPVGACFALNILFEGTIAEYQDDAVKKMLGEHSNIVARSIQHILQSVTSTGSLPYGVPFTYSPRGTGAFATSISGLAALSRFLSKLLYLSRKLDYPSRQVLKQLLENNFDNFEKLFMLLAMLVSSPRKVIVQKSVATNLIRDLNLNGWWTDRAPSNSRTESWVSVEVLHFAIYIHEFLQEFTQLFTYLKYGAIWPSQEPTWPYKPQARLAELDAETLKALQLQGLPILQDPDETDGSEEDHGRVDYNSAALGENRPVPFLHSHFNRFMPGNDGRLVSDWTQSVSSILLFGPPGTSKTTLVRSLAQALHWHFLELTPSNFIIEGLEPIEQQAKEIFEDLSTLRETVILFDELDSIFVDRERLPPESIVNFLVPAMLPKLQRLSKRIRHQRVLIVIATNFYDRLDPAMVRRGRIDKHLAVLPYNSHARMSFFRRTLGEHLDRSETLFTSNEDFLRRTALFVFEELLELSQTVNAGLSARSDTALPEHFQWPTPMISPTLYLSRIPTDLNKGSHIRSSERLAIEVCEVVERLLDLPKPNSHQTSLPALRSRLRSLQTRLVDEDYLEWRLLCERVSESLTLS